MIEAVEAFQPPAPDFKAITTTQPGSTRAYLFALKKLTDMDRDERVRACYQHACMMVVNGKRMTNASLRDRLGVEQQNYAAMSRIIRDAVDAELVKAFDPETSKRNMQYVPFWA